MNRDIVKAIRDWCLSIFQPKGSYLTEIPDNYITTEKLEQKGYLTDVPVASDIAAGGVKPDGVTIIMDGDGTIHAAGGGSAQTVGFIFTADHTVAVPFMLEDKDDVTEEKIEWKQEL